MRAKACLHSDHARWKLLESLGQCQPLDLATKSNLALSAETDDVEDFLANTMPIEAKGGVLVSMGCFSGCCGIVFTDYSPRRKQPVHPINGHPTC